MVFTVVALMGATMTINPIWNYGSYDPSPVSSGAQLDWYMLFLEGALRLMPGQAEVEFWGFTLPLNKLERWVRVQQDRQRPLVLPPEEDEHGVSRRKARGERLRSRLSRFYFEDRVEPVTPRELAAAAAASTDEAPRLMNGGPEPAALKESEADHLELPAEPGHQT